MLPKRARLSSDDVIAVDVQEGVGESIGMVENGESMWEDDESGAPALLVNFAKWLQSPDGEKKDSKTVKQHAAQINRILPIIDTEKNFGKSAGFCSHQGEICTSCLIEVFARNDQVLLYEPRSFIRLPFV